MKTKKFGSREIRLLMKEEYERSIKTAINEVDLFDSRGVLVIDKDLKVKHKPSGFIYTIDSVDGKNGSAKVTLRSPETPRVKPPPEAGPITTKPAVQQFQAESDEDEETEDMKDVGKKAYPKASKEPKESGEVIFVIDQKEFEKDYEEA
jgi:hypothetical protein